MPRRVAHDRARTMWVTVIGPLVAVLALVAACAPSVHKDEGEFGPRPAARSSAGCRFLEAIPVMRRLVVDGRERTILVTLPPGADTAPRDLVIAFHGRTNDAALARSYFELDDALPDAIVVYPRALDSGADRFSWREPSDPVHAQRDFALVRAIVDAFGRTHCLDLDRVFVVGHSLGASFANDVACTMADVVRAVASVAGGLWAAPCHEPVAALLIHHPDDALVPIAAGEQARDAFRAANGLAAESAAPATTGPLAALRCVRYGAEAAEHPVVWCPHDAAGSSGRFDPHTWPTGTGAAIAAFFAGLH